VIFLVVVSVGFRHGRSWLLPTTARVESALTQTEFQAFVARAVAEQVSFERQETQAATLELAASLRAEEMRNLARIAQQLHYLESAQNTMWKETQRQNEVISVVAHYRQPPTSSPEEPSRR
jgi:hypothetical protein